MSSPVHSAILAIAFAISFNSADNADAQTLPTTRPTEEQLANDNSLFLSLARKALKWEEPAEPVKIVEPLYFVGTKGLGVFLFTTSEGHILMNSGMPSSGPMIVQSIRKLGFRPEDIKIMINGHAHIDHAGAFAYLKQLSGAQLMVMREDVPAMESGDREDFKYGNDFVYPPVKVDRILRDGDTVQLGEVQLTAYHTPGHTRGATTWIATVIDGGRPYVVAFPDGAGFNPGYRLANNPSYPGIADDFRNTHHKLEMLKPDIWLAQHNEYYDLEGKRKRAEAEGVSAWLDPEGYRRWVASKKRAFEDKVDKEMSVEKTPTKAAATTTTPAATGVPVTVDSFVRAETDLYFGKTVKGGGFGTLRHRRETAPIDEQDVVRMNRDTLYSSGVFDLDAAPVTVTLPNPGERFMSLQVTSQDHYAVDVVYAPGRYTFTKDKVGTRYVFLAVRTLVDPANPDDLKAAHALQDAIRVEQANIGTFEVPNWDKTSQDKIRNLLNELSTMRSSDMGAMFGTKSEVDPVAHLIGAAIGWGGNPRSAAVYRGIYPKNNDGKTIHKLTVNDVPVDGFWSISVYNAEGYFEKNEFGAYSLNSITGKPNPDGSFTVQFGGCDGKISNCLPIIPGWNYTVRLYRPRAEILYGTWKFPEAQPVQ
jgi:metallo-beta-lactamase class B